MMSSYFPPPPPPPYVVYTLTYTMMNIICNAFKHIPAACLIILLGNYYKKKKEIRTLFQTTKNKKR